MENILELTRSELSEWLGSKGIRTFRAGQVVKWIYLRQANDFDEMTDLSKSLRSVLAKHFYIPRLVLEKEQVSKDATRKFLFRLSDGNHIEAVLIPERDYFTLCVSSQAGCAQKCRFCLTARGGFVRNLSAGEILAQVRDARYYLMKEGIDPLKLSNIVFMGMGEPLANYQHLVTAIETLTDTDYGLKFSNRRITVSTCGIVPNITRLGRDTDVNLAISLNATTDKVRDRLMPVNKKYPLSQLMEACRHFTMKPRNKITFEYILIAGVNDAVEDAAQLVKLLAPIRAKVNLIPFNEHPESPFQCPTREKIDAFLTFLLHHHMVAIVRKSKGRDILAACGQLRASQTRVEG